MYSGVQGELPRSRREDSQSIGMLPETAISDAIRHSGTADIRLGRIRRRRAGRAARYLASYSPIWDPTGVSDAEREIVRAWRIEGCVIRYQRMRDRARVCVRSEERRVAK